MSVGGDEKTVIASIFEHGPDRFLGVGKRFLLGVTFGDHFRQGRDKHGEAPALLRFEND